MVASDKDKIHIVLSSAHFPGGSISGTYDGVAGEYGNPDATSHLASLDVVTNTWHLRPLKQVDCNLASFTRYAYQLLNQQFRCDSAECCHGRLSSITARSQLVYYRDYLFGMTR